MKKPPLFIRAAKHSIQSEKCWPYSPCWWKKHKQL